jgi:hypothetical protein
MGSTATAIITACAAIAGVIIGGLFNLAMHRNVRRLDQISWSREAAERKKTRFHDKRLDAYTDFLALASNAFGYATQHVVERRRQAVGVGEGKSRWLLLRHAAQADSEEFNADAPRKMLRQATLVKLLTESADLYEVTDKLSTTIVLVFTIKDSGEDSAWEATFDSVLAEYRKATDKFMEAARKELTSD